MEKVGAYTDRATEIGEWRPGNPGLGQQATPMLAGYFNMLQRELTSLVEEGGGLPLDKDDEKQLLKTIRRMRGGAATNFGHWLWSDIHAGNPGAGRVALNNATPSLATELLIAEVSSEVVDFTQSLGLLRSGDTVTFHARDTAELSHRFRVTGPADDQGSYCSIPVVYVGGGGAAPDEDVVVSVLLTLSSDYSEQLGPWGSMPLGVPIPLLDHLSGVVTPPTDSDAYRYIKLTASDSYNAGVLTGESVTGSAPLVAATAVISLAGSPLNGQTVNLINTEKRVLRASVSSGELLNDAFQGHWHKGYAGANSGVNFGSSSAAVGDSPIDPFRPIREAVTDGVNGTPRTANETRPKSIGATYYMRIK